MKHFAKVKVMLIAMLVVALCVLTLSACQVTPPAEEDCTEHIDVDGNKVCDNCDAIIEEEPGDECEHVYTDCEDATCNECGETTRTAPGHTPAADDGDCTTDILCTACGKVAADGENKHTYTDDDDCTTELKCTKEGCSVVITPAKADHTYATEYSKDGQYHWHECTVAGCDGTDEKAAHSVNNADASCLTAETCVCGHVITAANANHSYATEYSKDGQYHWHECTVAGCDGTDTKEEHGATSDNDCTTNDKCDVCGRVVTAGNEKHPDENNDTRCDTEGCIGSVKIALTYGDNNVTVPAGETTIVTATCPEAGTYRFTVVGNVTVTVTYGEDNYVVATLDAENNSFEIDGLEGYVLTFTIAAGEEAGSVVINADYVNDNIEGETGNTPIVPVG